MIRTVPHTLFLLIALLMAGQAQGATFPKSVGSISEFLSIRLAAFEAPVIASARFMAAIDHARYDSTLEGAGFLASQHAVERARNVAENTHIAFVVWKKVGSRKDVEALERRYGFEDGYLQALNPGVDFTRLRQPTRILIYRFDPERPARSIGKANRGRLDGGMPMIDGPYWRVRFHNESWGTPATVSNIARGYHHVAEVLPGGSIAAIGDLSYQTGGRMPPHRSHRSGRDADISYFTLDPDEDDYWNARHSPNLDVQRQWELFRYWLERDTVAYLFVDYQVQKRLYWYALRSGEDKNFLDEVFQYPRWRGGRARIRHVAGHDDHYHVRFRCAEHDLRCNR